jgi:Transcriptional regulator, AbiEi antitoxin
MRSVSAKLRVARLADRQWGLVTASQLAALGIDTAVVTRWLRERYLYRIHPGVYAVAHRGGSVERDLAAALLYAGPGAMLSHATGVWWFGLIDHQPWPIQVSTPRRCRSVRGVQLHQRRTWERVWHKGLPVTTVEQALLDFAATAEFRRLRYALAVADYKKLLDLVALHATIEDRHPAGPYFGRARAWRFMSRHGSPPSRREPTLSIVQRSGLSAGSSSSSQCSGAATGAVGRGLTV